jgi:hypothetical protein
LTNEVEVKILEEFKTDLVDYLRRENQNRSLQLETELVHEEESDGIPYTNSERFKALIAANPILREMADKFGLDPEY